MAQMFTDVGRHTKFVLFELFVFAPPHQYHAFFSNTNLSNLTNADLVMRRPETSATEYYFTISFVTLRSPSAYVTLFSTMAPLAGAAICAPSIE